MIPTEEAFGIRADLEERETTFAGWYKMWKRRGRRQDPIVETHADFTYMPFIRFYEEVAYEGLLASLMTQLRNDVIVPKGAFLLCSMADMTSTRSGLLTTTLTGQKRSILRSGFGLNMKGGVD